MKNLLTIIMLSFSLTIFAQNQLQQAITYYNQKQYEKAAVLFKRLYRERKTKFYFDYYLSCLLRTGQYDKALKEIDRQIKKRPYDLIFLADKAEVLKLTGSEQQANQLIKTILKKLPAEPNTIIQIANNFLRYKDYDAAEKVLNKGEKLTGRHFYQIRYTLYALQRNYDKLLDVLLAWLGSQPQQFKHIQKILHSYLKNDVGDELSNMLFKKLIIRIQKTHIPVYYRLLIWYLIQKQQFDLALIQAIAYNRRIHGFGSEIYNVGIKALESDSLETATQAFNYIIKQGVKNPYYFKAQTGLTRVMFLQITKNKYAIDRKKLIDLENQYKQILQQSYIPEKDKITLIEQLADLQAFYLNKPDTAYNLLQQFINDTYLDNKAKGQLLIEQGKILLKQHKFYAAILKFAKAADLNANNELSNQATFMQALTYFYMGNFHWAKTQFDILKGQTDKLYANDAILYSEIIQQALEDSTKLPVLHSFAKAQYYEFIFKPDSALILLDSIINQAFFLADFALLEKYKIHYNSGQYQLAAKDLLQLINNFTSSLIIDKATYLLARLYETKLNDPQKAIEYYKKILFDYRGSIYTDPARTHFRRLMGQFKN